MDGVVNRLEVLAIIPARGGSKGIPGKNIKIFAGYPLISYSIAAALQSKMVTRTIVSTDDEKIAAVAREVGDKHPSCGLRRSPRITPLICPFFSMRSNG